MTYNYSSTSYTSGGENLGDASFSYGEGGAQLSVGSAIGGAIGGGGSYNESISLGGGDAALGGAAFNESHIVGRNGGGVYGGRTKQTALGGTDSSWA